MKTWVLCLNDFPVGAYSTEILANEAAQEDKNRRHSSRPLMMHYHIHYFEIDADATL
jgi:hypothetical protein